MSWIHERQEQAAQKVAAEISKPLDDGEMDEGDFFDPWSLFPSFYGSYSGDFDWCMVGVLEGLTDDSKQVWDLTSHMFREVLCKASLCDYGTSPRACFATTEFSAVLPDLIQKWKRHYENKWGEEWPK